jgi:hypothetical protein
MIITIEQLSQNFDSIHAAQVTAGKLMVRIMLLRFVVVAAAAAVKWGRDAQRRYKCSRLPIAIPCALRPSWCMC